MSLLRNYHTLVMLKRLKYSRSDYNNANIYFEMTFSLPLPSPSSFLVLNFSEEEREECVVRMMVFLLSLLMETTDAHLFIADDIKFLQF